MSTAAMVEPTRAGDATLYLGDALEVLRGLPEGSVDAVVTDPPAGIGFMGRAWDRAKDRAAFVDFLAPRLAECLRVARPGSYMLCWALPRTSHWTATAIEDAGWVVRDRISHIFGQGFPKGKACLKPAVEDWWLAWKPDRKVTPLNIDACRIGTTKEIPGGKPRRAAQGPAYGELGNDPGTGSGWDSQVGRYPANLVLSHSPGCNGECEPSCPVRLLDEQAGERTSGILKAGTKRTTGGGYMGNFPEVAALKDYGGDTGGASRFFYCPKASRSDRGEGNIHPTVKSTALMRWLIRLIASPGDIVLDPFLGSGSTIKAAILEGMRAIGIDSSPEYHAIAARRLAAELEKTALLRGAE